MSFDWQNVALFGLAFVVLGLLQYVRYLVTGNATPSHWKDSIGRWDDAQP